VPIIILPDGSLQQVMTVILCVLAGRSRDKWKDRRRWDGVVKMDL
jgi:hypothetical protein